MLCLLACWPLRPAGAAPPDTGTAVLQVFVREGCPHCAEAKRWLEALALERPDLQIRLRPVDQDPEAAAELSARSRAAGVWPPGVPSFLIGERLLVGFDDARHRGQDVLALLPPAPAAPAASKAASAASAPAGTAAVAAAAPTPSASAAADSVDTPWGRLSASRIGLPAFTLALGLLDGFNPCAMWVLLFLLSLLVRLHDRRRMALIAGTFVLASGAVYFAFMAAWLNLFLAVGLSGLVRRTLAVLALLIGAINVKDFVAFGHGPTLSIPAAAKPGLYARMRAVVQAPGLPASLLGVAALAVVVNLIELLCTAGLPALFTAVLAQHGVGTAERYAYLALYIVAYVADDSLMVTAAVLALGSGKLTERAGRWLKLLSGVVMLALGVVLLWRPQWLL